MKLYKLKYLFISTLCIFISSTYSTDVFSQIFSAEQNPPSIKWLQINSTNFQIIYPTELEIEAQRMANTLEHVVGAVSKSLNTKPRKISILLQNQSLISNGFVQLAPRRSEFFTTSPQNIDFQDWLNSLAIHELRHVVQFDKLNPNLKAPFFEELALAIFGISLPPWFFEGDAVGIETALKIIKGAEVKVCEEHGKVACPICTAKNLPVTTIHLNALPDDWIVVFDSLTQLANSAMNNITKNQLVEWLMAQQIRGLI
jgi:hypothetical protein